VTRVRAGRAPYRAGRDFEARVRAALEASGWWVVRSAGSQGAVDLVAGREGVWWLVQCKRGGRGQLGPRARWALWTAATRTWAVPVLAVADRGATGPVAWWRLDAADPPGGRWTPVDPRTAWRPPAPDTGWR